MAIFQVLMHYPDGTDELEDEVYDSYEAADAAGLDNCSCYVEGGEILNMSNPGDYPLQDDADEVDYEVIEVDD